MLHFLHTGRGHVLLMEALEPILSLSPRYTERPRAGPKQCKGKCVFWRGQCVATSCKASLGPTAETAHSLPGAESFSQGWLEPRNRDSKSGTNFSLKAGLVTGVRNPHTKILAQATYSLTHKSR